MSYIFFTIVYGNAKWCKTLEQWFRYYIKLCPSSKWSNLSTCSLRSGSQCCDCIRNWHQNINTYVKNIPTFYVPSWHQQLNFGHAIHKSHVIHKNKICAIYSYASRSGTPDGRINEQQMTNIYTLSRKDRYPTISIW